MTFFTSEHVLYYVITPKQTMASLANFPCFFTFLLLSIVQCHAVKIAVVLWPNGASHYYMIDKVVNELESRGHEVTYVMCSMDPEIASMKVKKLIYDTPYPPNHLVKVAIGMVMEKGFHDMSDIFGVMRIISNICDSLLLDEGLLSKLKGYDLVFADNSFGGCGQLVQRKVGIPFIVDFSGWGLNNDLFNFYYGVPWPVSYVPGDIIPSSTKMSFLQRVSNLLLFSFTHLMASYIRHYGVGSLKHKHNIAPDRSFSQLIQETDLVLMPVDWALEWARPLPPNVKMIGSTNQRPSGKLPQDLEDFMQSAGSEGVVLVSFGSMVGQLGERQTEILVKAFSQLKYKVLWKYTKNFPCVQNIKTVTWMPQNDILGHPQLKLFMTHGGANSVHEAAYHAVPLLITPLWGDQLSFAQKIQAAGMGSSIDIRVNTVFTAEDIVEAISELIENSKYKTNALGVSKLMKDRPRPASQEGADWIEYVLRNNGTRHLLPRGTSMPFYQYFMLDITLFLLLVVVLVVFILMRFCKCLKKTCSKADKEKMQ